ncbi:MAG: hypothetical protein JWN04_66 [Myxococcaceae bacterium]|nr:hypothetical protein [Myxococcaceae bacterium]
MTESPVRLDSIWGDALHLRGMSGREGLSQPFELTLQLYTETTNDVIELEGTLGSAMTVRLPLADGKERFFSGHVVEAAEAGVTDGHCSTRRRRQHRARQGQQDAQSDKSISEEATEAFSVKAGKSIAMNAGEGSGDVIVKGKNVLQN